jgi:hypothetical protein
MTAPLEFEVHGARVVEVSMRTYDHPDVIKFSVPEGAAEAFAQQLEQLATAVRSAVPYSTMAVRPYIADADELTPAAPGGVWQP